VSDVLGEPTDWACRWEDARHRALTLGARTTAAQRIEWLEAAMRLALASGAMTRALEARAGRIGGPWDASDCRSSLEAAGGRDLPEADPTNPWARQT